MLLYLGESEMEESRASGILYIPSQRSRHQLLGFYAEQPDPITKRLLNARHWALPGRMAVVKGAGGFCLLVAQPHGGKTLRKFADTGFPNQSRTSNNTGNAKRLPMINC